MVYLVQITGKSSASQYPFPKRPKMLSPLIPSVFSLSLVYHRLVEETENLARHMASTGFLVVHDSSRSSEDDILWSVSTTSPLVVRFNLRRIDEREAA
jgi:hypothetical protein